MKKKFLLKLFPITHSFKRGFTLIELLVSLAIFILFLGVVTTSYLGIVRSQQQANGVRKMYSDVRDFMEMVSQDMRLGTLDYDCYENISIDACPVPPGDITISPEGMSQYLAIVNKDKTEKTLYWFDAQNHQVKLRKFIFSANTWTPASEYTVSATDTGDGFRPLLGEHLIVKYLAFSVYPTVNPYSSSHFIENQSQFQPKVSIFLSVVNANKNSPPFTLHLQTTLSSRVYSRNGSTGSP